MSCSVILFLAALVCLGHTIFRLRSNVLRLTRLSMRPVPEATSGIGLWHNLLLFEARACVLVNCLIVSVSTDQLDYFSCYSHSLFRDQGECESGNVPMTSRFLIAAVAGYVILAVTFLIDTVVPDQQEAVQTRLKNLVRDYEELFEAYGALHATHEKLQGDFDRIKRAQFRNAAAINQFQFYFTDPDPGRRDHLRNLRRSDGYVAISDIMQFPAMLCHSITSDERAGCLRASG